MEKKKIGIIFGGKSPEYDVSLESAYSVITNINKEKYDIALIGITKQRNWYKYEGEIEKIKRNKDCKRKNQFQESTRRFQNQKKKKLKNLLK